MSITSFADLLQVEEIQHHSRSRGLHNLDARIKLAMAVVAIILNVALADLRLSLGLGALAWGGMLLSRVSVRRMAWFVIAPSWATLIIAGGYAFGFGATPLVQWGSLTIYREGAWQGVGVIARVLADMGWAGLLFLTTPFPRILAALRWFRLPAVLADTLGFMYRYMFLLWEEFSAMRLSARARGGMSTFSGHLKTTGTIVGHVFLRAYDRAERVSLAMKARGEDCDGRRP